MGLFNSTEKKLKKQIMDRAIAMAEQAYQKDFMFRDLQARDLNYAIIKDLMHAAKLTGKVTIKLHGKDGSPSADVIIENVEQREELNRMDANNFYAGWPESKFNQVQT